MTLSASEIVLLTTVAVLGVAAIVTSTTKNTIEEEILETPLSPPRSAIVIEEID